MAFAPGRRALPVENRRQSGCGDAALQSLEITVNIFFHTHVDACKIVGM